MSVEGRPPVGLRRNLSGTIIIASRRGAERDGVFVVARGNGEAAAPPMPPPELLTLPQPRAPPVLRRNPSASVVFAASRAVERDAAEREAAARDALAALAAHADADAGGSTRTGRLPLAALRRCRMLRCCACTALDDLRELNPLLILICGVGDATYTALVPFFPQAAEAAGLSPSATGVVFSCFMWGGLAVTPLATRLSQTASSRALLTSCVLLQATLTGLFAIVPLIASTPPRWLALAIALRLCQGVVATIYEVALSSLIMCSVKPTSVAAALGVQEAARGVGLMLGPALGGALFELGGFKLPFIACACALLALGLAVALTLPADDDLGADENARPATFRQLLALPAVGVVLVLMTALSLALTAPDPVLGPYAQSRFGLSPAQIGLLFSSSTVAYAILSPAIGAVGASVGNFNALTLGLVAAAIAFLILGPSPSIPAAVLRPSAGLLFVGMGLSGVGDSTLTCGVAAMLDAALAAGFETEAVADVVGGLLSVSWTLGALLGPVHGSVLVETLGFPRAMSATAFALLLIAALGVIAHGCAVRSAATAARTARRRPRDSAQPEQLVAGATEPLQAAPAEAGPPPRQPATSPPSCIVAAAREPGPSRRRAAACGGTAAAAAIRGQHDLSEPLLNAVVDVEVGAD
ncbi:hypothetical protein KFE25_004981 [Diacronema lutheri]|uniref:Major facilitator superfamily (MFS) profile domain-containing protein n=1 Tax=Diacronema lutheri TaxID=2081491 RepID=A0A8J5XHY1_DIALT|nr:hypothetical protein KFE25_004981 [Diacronema lutheri]